MIHFNRSLNKTNWFNCAKVFLYLVIIVFAFLTVYTYYKELSQYQTADQTLTLSRINSFLSAPEKYDVAMGTNFSNIIVGIPGSWLANIVSSKFGPDKHLFFGIHYNSIVPFSLIQVSISLILIIICVLLTGSIIGWKPKKDWIYYILLFDLVANLPVLKGMAKVLKYDIFSVILTVLALLSFILFKESKRRRYLFLTSLFSALSFIEKEVAFLTAGFILAYEAGSLAFSTLPIREFLRKIFNSYLVFIASFLLTTFLFVPRFWHAPKETFSIISRLLMYLNLKELGVLLATGVIILLLMFIFKTQFKRFLSVHKKKIAYFSFALVGILFLSGILYQSNNMHVYNTKQIYDYVSENKLFVGKEVVGQRITTLDKSYVVTAIKIFYNEFRIILYMFPEIFTLIILLTPLLVAYKKSIFRVDEGSALITVFSLYSLFFMFIAAITISPVEAKYLGSVFILLSLIAGLIVCQFIKEMRNSYVSVAVIIFLLAAIIRPAFSDGPAYFSYMSSFRNLKYEDATKYQLSDDSFWTWVGWGETSYNLIKALEKEGGSGIIAFDYLPPFYQSPQLKYLEVFSAMQNTPDKDKLKSVLKELREEKGVQYIVISKNMANRYYAPNYIMNEYKRRAIYVDKVNNVEYGWLFEIEDLQK